MTNVTKGPANSMTLAKGRPPKGDKALSDAERAKTYRARRALRRAEQAGAATDAKRRTASVMRRACRCLAAFCDEYGKEDARMSQPTVWVMFKGKRPCLADAVRAAGSVVSYDVARDRIKRMELGH